MAAFLNHVGIPLLFDPLLIPLSADIGIKEDAHDGIIVRPLPSLQIQLTTHTSPPPRESAQ